MLFDSSNVEKKLESLDLVGLANYMSKCQNIICMIGAGVSTCKFQYIVDIKYLLKLSLRFQLLVYLTFEHLVLDCTQNLRNIIYRTLNRYFN